MFTQEGIDIFIIFKEAAEIVEQLYMLYLKDTLDPVLPLIEKILNIFTVLFIIGIVIVLIKFREVRKKEVEFYKPIAVKDKEEGENKTQWEIISNHVSSKNPAEWKIAIIEADNILKEIGYEGETLADRLKSAGDSESIQQAWEAHKVRNAIAHEGGKELTQHEAKRVISLYEGVFKRFGYL